MNIGVFFATVMMFMATGVAAFLSRHPGLVIAHRRFPGIFIIGDDQSLFHKPSVIQFP